MNYLVVQDWHNTHGNHAGMVHMCDLLVRNYPLIYTKICKPIEKDLSSESTLKILLLKTIRRAVYLFSSRLWVKYYMPYCRDMIGNLCENDRVFLLQYNSSGATQDKLAVYIRRIFPSVILIAMSHLTKSKYLEVGFNAKVIRKWDSYIDFHIPMGSSLVEYLEECGVDKRKIKAGFHYVDSDYYFKNESEISLKSKLTIIAMGALQRDLFLLAEIINDTPEVNWIVCKGGKNIDGIFNCSNVELFDYVTESELKELMNNSDASINVLEDTVGSNVITTSLAMGLIIIVSDVGSIRDYVDDSCAIFCQNTKQSFKDGIDKLINNRSEIVNMRLNALRKSKNLSIHNVHNWFSNIC